jgi:hypothetical protein
MTDSPLALFLNRFIVSGKIASEPWYHQFKQIPDQGDAGREKWLFVDEAMGMIEADSRVAARFIRETNDVQNEVLLAVAAGLAGGLLESRWKRKLYSEASD